MKREKGQTRWQLSLAIDWKQSGWLGTPVLQFLCLEKIRLNLKVFGSKFFIHVTIQIMTGVMVFFLGIVLTTSDYGYTAILVYSGISYWGSLIYISAGSLSVASQNQRNHLFVIKASLGMNVFSAITAGFSILLMCLQISLISKMDPSFYPEYLMLRVIGIMLLFTIPQFFISIYISAFACKASCNRDSTVLSLALN